MDPNAPLTKQLYAKFFCKSFYFASAQSFGLYMARISITTLQQKGHRSLIQKKLDLMLLSTTLRRVWFDQIFLEYKGSLGGALHFRSYAGLLESMYAGIRHNLYERFGSRWAVGATING